MFLFIRCIFKINLRVRRYIPIQESMHQYISVSSVLNTLQEVYFVVFPLSVGFNLGGLWNP